MSPKLKKKESYIVPYIVTSAQVAAECRGIHRFASEKSKNKDYARTDSRTLRNATHFTDE